MKVAIVAVTKKGKSIALRLKKSIPESKLYIPKGRLKGLIGKIFNEFEGIIFCMAAGIVIRVIAPYIKSKHLDPAVVVVDDEARFAISLLSGHEGGANCLAVKAANILGAEPVITTASESAKKIIIGIGCRRGISKNEIIKALRYALAVAGYTLRQVRHASSVDLKENEPGLKMACRELGIPLRIISRELIKRFSGPYNKSSFVKEKIGIEGVSEPCALITARKPKLILAKTKIGKVTVALVKDA